MGFAALSFFGVGLFFGFGTAASGAGRAGRALDCFCRFSAAMRADCLVGVFGFNTMIPGIEKSPASGVTNLGRFDACLAVDLLAAVILGVIVHDRSVIAAADDGGAANECILKLSKSIQDSDVGTRNS